MRRSILVVAPYLPLPATFGGALRIYNLIEGLARNHDVSLLAPGRDADVAAMLELGKICDVTLAPAGSTPRQPASSRKRLNQMRSLASGRTLIEMSSFNSRMQAAMDRLFMTRRFDLVQYEFPESALYIPPENIPTVFDAHNVEHDLLARVARSSAAGGKQIYNLLEWRKMKRLEVRGWNRASACVATSERDAALMRALTSTPVDVVPNGVDLDYFGAAGRHESQPQHIVFTGAMRHQPNADGAIWYARHVHPLVKAMLPRATFTVAGADPPGPVLELDSPSVRVTGAVDDIRQYLGTAQVVVVPLWSGGGTRLKVLEAFAANRPVVSTTLGVEGLDVRHGEHLLIADSPADFAQAVVALIHDRGLARRLTAAGRKLVEEHYGWESIARRLEAVHGRMLADSSRQGDN